MFHIESAISALLNDFGFTTEQLSLRYQPIGSHWRLFFSARAGRGSEPVNDGVTAFVCRS
jgi:hypothetical protein